MPRVTFILADGTRRPLDAADGASLLEIAQANGIDIEGACEGSMACSTCHVIVDKAWFGRLPPADADEDAMLDLAAGVTGTSRLGCQVRLTRDLDGLVVSLPARTRNLLLG